MGASVTRSRCTAGPYVTVTNISTVRVWRAPGEADQADLKKVGKDALVVAWNRDNRHIATTVAAPHMCVIWDAGTGDDVHEIAFGRRCVSGAWSPDGRTFATADANRAAYVHHLLRRLEARAGFVEEAVHAHARHV